MTDIRIDITKEPTYEKGLGWRNSEGRVNHEGAVVKWMTKGGLPVMVPDQWEGSMPDVLEPLPKGVRHIKIGQSTEEAFGKIASQN